MSLGGGSNKSAVAAATKQTEYEKASAEQAINSWNDFVTRFAPVEDRFIQLTGNTGARRSRALADASAEAYTKSGADARSIIDSGRRPADGPTMAGFRERTNTFRRGLAAAAGATEPALYETQQRGRLKLAALGRGLSDASMTNMGSIARDASAVAIENAQNRMAERNAMLDAAFGATGMWAAQKYGDRL